MELSKIRTITNSYTDVRLASLQKWKSAADVTPRDHGGPYAVLQDGYDPADLTLTPDEFILAKTGEWVSTGIFFKLPGEVRRRQFIFGTAAEVVDLLGRLTGEVRMFRSGGTTNFTDEPDDELEQAVRTATLVQAPAESTAPKMNP